MVPVAFEVEHRIDDVFEHARPGDGSRLRHVPDEERGHVHAFGEVHQRRGALAHLADRPRRALDIRTKDRLDRIDDEHVGLGLLRGGDDLFDVGFGEEQERLGRDAEALGAELDLPQRLLAGDVEHAAIRQVLAQFGHQRALADAGVARDERQRAVHNTAAHDAVELGHAR